MKINRRIANRIFWKYLACRHPQEFYERVLDVTLKAMNYGLGDDFMTSGEQDVMRYVKGNCKSSNQIVFDVGANVGGYTLMLSEVFGQSSIIHAFEPSKRNFLLLEKAVGSLNNVEANCIGCSDAQGEMKLFSTQSSSGLTSVYNRQLNYHQLELDEVEEASFTTIDHYCKEKGINHIHFLKMDIEGHELAALKGASEMLFNNAVDYIQFEFGGCNIDSRTYFRDFWNLLHEKYRIYRVLQNGLYELAQYGERYEIFETVNYLAELR